MEKDGRHCAWPELQAAKRDDKFCCIKLFACGRKVGRITWVMTAQVFAKFRILGRVIAGKMR